MITGMPPIHRGLLPLALMLSLGVARPLAAQARDSSHAYELSNLVSDQSGKADHVDANLVNAWGVAFNPSGFVWVANNHSGTSTLYDGLGNPQTLVVTVQARLGAPEAGSPTGIVFNGSNVFVITGPTGAMNPARFIFATEEGGISAWAPPATGTMAIGVASGAGAVYKGLALGGNGVDFLLYAADFANRKVDVYDKAFKPTTVPGGFADPNLPPDFSPFGIQNINGDIYVTFAKKEPGQNDETAGPGLGFVDVFDGNGTLVRRVASRGKLNAPWGLALAPASFGKFSNDLLVGNFGDGAILAFDAHSGDFRGRLHKSNGKLLKVDGLWGMAFGNGINNQGTNALFVAAGPEDEAHGSYGKITAVPGGRADDHDDDQ